MSCNLIILGTFCTYQHRFPQTTATTVEALARWHPWGMKKVSVTEAGCLWEWFSKWTLEMKRLNGHLQEPHQLQIIIRSGKKWINKEIFIRFVSVWLYGYTVVSNWQYCNSVTNIEFKWYVKGMWKKNDLGTDIHRTNSWYIQRQIRFHFCLWDLKNNTKIYLVNPESVHGHLWECKNTQFVWELNWGFVKADVSRAVHTQECSLRELSLYKTPNSLLFYIIWALNDWNLNGLLWCYLSCEMLLPIQNIFKNQRLI